MSDDHITTLQQTANQVQHTGNGTAGRESDVRPTGFWIKHNDKVSGDGAAYVDHDYYWRPLETAPHGVKLQLLSIYGVAAHGLLSPAIIEDGFWIGWTPLPKLKKEKNDN